MISQPRGVVGKGPGAGSAEDPAREGSTSSRREARARIEKALSGAHSAEACVELAHLAEHEDEPDLQCKCLTQALALDRRCLVAMMTLAASAKGKGDLLSAFAFLEEAAREKLLPRQVEPFHRDLLALYSGDNRLREYLSISGRIGRHAAATPLSIVLITNLFPPQELGGYGRMMWEFAHGLIGRGHRVRILTSDVQEFGHPEPSPEEGDMEVHVLRTLRLLGTWVGGRVAPLQDPRELRARTRANVARVQTALARSGADLILAGNIDLLGIDVLQPAFLRKVPVLHALANAAPGYAPQSQPVNEPYWVAPCSDWNGAALRAAGFAPTRVETLYPGARIDRFFRLFMPDTRRLRICYASLVMAYKGADTLVQALGRLHAAGVDFTAEIAGDAPDASFLKALQDFVADTGMGAKVRFTGYLNRGQLLALFARSNTLVFPSRFEEPFGISQVEALASGLVVVSSGTGGAKEIIRDGTDGMLFPAGNDGELARRLVLLGSDPGLMARLQRQGQIRSKEFSVDRAVARIESLAGEMRAARPHAVAPAAVPEEIHA